MREKSRVIDGGEAYPALFLFGDPVTATPRIPRWKRAWQRWMRLATLIGEFQARVILSLFYFVIVLPFGLAVRLFADPLGIKGRRQSTWTDFSDRSRTLEDTRRQA